MSDLVDSFLKFLDHTILHKHTPSRAALSEWSARHRGL